MVHQEKLGLLIRIKTSKNLEFRINTMIMLLKSQFIILLYYIVGFGCSV